MPNHLAGQSSPYLLQHQDNPVDWYPWGDEAVLLAQKQNKPIFLSIGYSTCHWCHVMAHESFTNKTIARYLNDHFISIKVDREEKPDLDTIYMTAVVGITGQGGWPLTVFLTPDLYPFYGGTYFPPEPRYGMPGFLELITSVNNAWMDQQIKIIESSITLFTHVSDQLSQDLDPRKKVSLNGLRSTAEQLIKSFNPDHGGWGNAPMFPMAMTLDFLLQESTRNVALSYEVVNRSLEKMISGGMWDLVGGGFHRYSTDAHWHIPHYEKMLYDNALLTRVYLHAYQINKNPKFKEVVEKTIDFVFRDLESIDGVYFSALDADSPEGEGSYYLWSAQEIRNAIQTPADYGFFEACFPEILKKKHLITLHKPSADIELANTLQIPIAEFHEKEKYLLSKLKDYRKTRPLPDRDEKVILSWNCLMITTLAEVAASFGSLEYLQKVNTALEFISTNMIIGDKAYRTWKDGKVGEPGHLDDYAGLVLALLAGYEISTNVRWFILAGKMIDLMVTYFSSSDGSFNDNIANKYMIVNPKSFQDLSIPSGNSLAAQALLKYSYMTDSPDYNSRSIHLLESMQETALQNPLAFSYWLQVMDYSIGPIQQLAVISTNNKENLQIQHQLRANYRPRLVICSSSNPQGDLTPSLLKDRHMLDDKTTYYLCQNFTCHMPMTDIHRINRLIGK